MNNQATAIWAKFKQWYGHSFTEKHGATPSREWTDLLNGIDRETAINALSAIKRLHTKFPPTLMEVQSAIRNASKKTETVNVRTVLNEYILTEYHAGRLGITFRQLGMPWQWIADVQSGLDSQGVMRDNQIVEYRGVRIPADPRNESTRACQVMFAEIDPYQIPALLAKNNKRYVKTL
jgi:hypothetical protein